MKVFLAALLALAGGTIARAQEAELAPIVVTGTFELNRRPSVTDQFTEHLLKQLEVHRALEEAVERAPWYYSRFWGYMPMKLQSTFDDSAKFFTPGYLTSQSQHVDQALRKSDRESARLFER